MAKQIRFYMNVISRRQTSQTWYHIKNDVKELALLLLPFYCAQMEKMLHLFHFIVILLSLSRSLSPSILQKFLKKTTKQTIKQKTTRCIICPSIPISQNARPPVGFRAGVLWPPPCLQFLPHRREWHDIYQSCKAVIHFFWNGTAGIYKAERTHAGPHWDSFTQAC